MKTVLLLLCSLLYLNCFSQKNDRQFTVIQIDSIVLTDNNRYLMADSGLNVQISNVDGPKVTGRGGSSISSYVWHFDKENYNKLSKKERQKYPIYKKSRLIRADYHEAIHYDDNYSIETLATLYYAPCNKLFFVKIKKTTFLNSKEINSYTFEISNPEYTSTHQEELITELGQWIENKSEEIIQQHKDIYQCE